MVVCNIIRYQIFPSAFSSLEASLFLDKLAYVTLAEASFSFVSDNWASCPTYHR